MSITVSTSAKLVVRIKFIFGVVVSIIVFRYLSRVSESSRPRVGLQTVLVFLITIPFRVACLMLSESLPERFFFFVFDD